jgi:MFS family permease
LGVQHLWVIVPLLATYGFLQAAPWALFPLLTAESMGLKRNGAIFGIVSVANTVGAVFGPPVAGSIFDATQSYTTAYSLFAAAYFGGAIASYMARPSGGVRGVCHHPRPRFHLTVRRSAGH